MPVRRRWDLGPCCSRVVYYSNREARWSMWSDLGSEGNAEPTNHIEYGCIAFSSVKFEGRSLVCTATTIKSAC